jgi:hypothetical protein
MCTDRCFLTERFFMEIDEVFLLVSRGDRRKEDKLYLASSQYVGASGVKMDETFRSTESPIVLETDQVFARHMRALLKKRAVNFQRDKKAWCCTALVPVIFVTLGFVICEFASLKRNMDPLTLDLSELNSKVTVPPINPIPVNSPGNSYSCQPGTCAYNTAVVSNLTDEMYLFCGVQGNLGIGLNSWSDLGSDLNVWDDLDAGFEAWNDSIAPLNQCMVFESTTILDTLNGFRGAQIAETNVSSIVNVRHIRRCVGIVTATSCLTSTLLLSVVLQPVSQLR